MTAAADTRVPCLHLIAGLPCSGKTTYADALSASTGAVLFTLDRWLITMFGRYSIGEVGQDEHTRRVLACRELIWEVADQLLRRSVDVILDDGFFLRDHRVGFIEAAARAGVTVKTHFLDTPLEVIDARIQERNAKLPTFNFQIDPDALKFFAAWFQRPTPEEGAQIVIAS
ncbi:MAG TPA: ATP-binding protein [Candidatus Binatia bacterium]|nr:ATP-binding protein [Candidatus Binatia bacterium]